MSKLMVSSVKYMPVLLMLVLYPLNQCKYAGMPDCKEERKKADECSNLFLLKLYSCSVEAASQKRAMSNACFVESLSVTFVCPTTVPSFCRPADDTSSSDNSK